MTVNQQGETMYYCNCCQNEFYHLRKVTEVHNECFDKAIEVFYECPYCNSMDIDLKEEQDD